MNIVFVSAPPKGDNDLLLSRFADCVAARGIRACGIVQNNVERCDRLPCDMEAKVLPDGPRLRISQSLGRGARGCRLDSGALEEAVGLVSTHIQGGADLLIVNKFGKHEAAGRGMREVIGEALSRDIPVIVGLNPLNAAPFIEFTGGEAVGLPADLGALMAWVESVVSQEERHGELA
ncbi:DUF2478 domain-containing protein [Oricola cellulosilytica]|uniref:DUF2478 domain-containing protein n=1 Tax=Oricola cellulosilytica TaxID=1429082 RepID=A0A4R0PCL7_9HYPH|nr:DUF2478 domain-containing protein [Oricola cellulosilytica]TCD13834.1 DUF2478 domain-containing protein [Oricola cellulosilytica]